MEKMGQAAKEGKRSTTSGAARLLPLLLVLCALTTANPSLAASRLSQTRVRAFEQQNQHRAPGRAELTLRLHRGKSGSLVTIRVKCKQLFTGEQRDPETGMYYLRARYYDPEIGRFITRDTWPGDQQRPMSLNKYMYAEGNPVVFVDPSGHFLGGMVAVVATIGILSAIATPSYADYIGGGGSGGSGSRGNCLILVGEHDNDSFLNAALTTKRRLKSDNIKCDVVSVRSGKAIVDELEAHTSIGLLYYYGHGASDGLLANNSRDFFESLYTERGYQERKWGLFSDEGVFGNGAASVSEISSNWFAIGSEIYLKGCFTASVPPYGGDSIA